MRPHPNRAASRLVVAGLLLLAAAAAAYGTLRLTFGYRPVYVNVRWAPDVDDAARARLEQRYGLSQGEFREVRTWGYALVDRSRDNIRALVGDPAVGDTHQIHRTAFRVGYFAQRLPYPTPRAWIAVGLERLVLLCLLFGLVGLGLALLEVTAPRVAHERVGGLRDAFLSPRATFDRVARLGVAWLRARIPVASAEAVALFRIVFGSAVVLFVLGRPVPGAWAAEPSNVVSAPHRLVLRIVAEAPWIADWIPLWLAVWGALFIAGAMARTSFAMMTAGVFAWAVLYTTRTTYHTVSALLVALVCLLWSRWGDGWSVDAWWRGRGASADGRGRQPRGTPREYGYAVWAPGLVLGVAYAAAAFAKLHDGGLAWILNGTVKYHFLSDSRQAMVDWGLDLARSHPASVVLSFGAIAIESLVIVAVFSRAYRYRLVGGVAALSLLMGFALLQGLVWPAWWILLLSFLPWHLVRQPDPSGRGEAPTPASWRQLLQPAPVVVILALVGVQLVVSLARVEMSPLLSTYDMYSTTYGSPAEYEQKAGQEYWIVATDDQARRHECRITRLEADTIAGAASERQALVLMAEPLRRCPDAPVQLERVSVEATRPRIDWAQWRLLEPARTRLMGPIPVQ